MQHDHAQSAAMRDTAQRARRTARQPWLRLLSAMLELGRGKGDLIRHSETPWAAATFAGTRHRLLISFAGADAVLAGESLIDALPEHEFAIPGQLVADATVIAAEHTVLPEPRLEIEAELLLLETD